MSDRDVEADIEQCHGYPKDKADKATIPSYASGSVREPNYEETTIVHQPYFRRIIESFKRDPNLKITPDGVIGANGHVFHSKAAAQNTANSPLARKLKGRHLQMIAIGGSIGTGLFVASGKALEAGGPASLLISFSLVGIMLFCTMHALGEMAVLFPVAGSFSAYSTRFLDPAWGFAMGWNYAMQWLCVLPLEIIAASITVNYWDDQQKYPHSIFVSIFLVLIVTINMFGVRGYGEAEFIFSLVKIVAVIGFILLGIILNCGGGPDSGYIGGRFWSNPGAFNNGFKGLCSVFVTAAFAFAGTELVGLAAAETANPRKSLPTAIKQVFWRISIFYIASLTVVGLLVPYDEPRLLKGGNAIAAASPFVISINNAGIEILPSVMNVVILIAVLSVGNSAIFGSSRTLAALADQGQAPKFLSYIDRKGRPLLAICFASSMGLVAFVADSGSQGTILDWMLALSGLSSIFTWGSICLSHIRFRRAWKAQGHTLDQLAFRSQPGVFGSWIGFAFNFLVLVAQFWTGAFPVGYERLTSAQQVKHFFLAYLAAPIVIMFYLCYKFYFKTSIMRSKDMDLTTGRRELNLPALIAEEQTERAAWPRWKRGYKTLC
ncbi:probable amino acid transport protein GAP1 [Rhynchosporium secalis]|uniref:Probable amino acid transport protein GAP1 n=1 Tax=Rhynchosporium secalis TaxID=38038 RepID=A0A1E1MGT6_RHYSE|nr:probable amino acid transport protein GAP1 [Rhynchosporium secalis]